MSIIDNRVSIFLGDGLALDDASKSKIDKIVFSLSDLEKIIILPDVHSKPDNPIPTGLVIAAKNTIYPFAIGQEIGCGVRVLDTSLDVNDISKDTIDKLFKNIKILLRDKIKKSPLVSKDEFTDILLKGPLYAKDKFFFEQTVDLENSRLNLPNFDAKVGKKDRLLHFIPKEALQGGFYKLGALGGGNHFLELQVIDKIFNRETAARQGLEEGRLVFMFHSGAGVFAKRADNYYVMRIQKHRWDKNLRTNMRKWRYHLNDFNFKRIPLRSKLFFKQNFEGLDANTPEGQRYLFVLKAAFNYSYVNRSFISQFILEALSKTLNKKISMKLIADFSHERIDYENIDGKSLWVHRNGASRVTAKDGDTFFPIPSFPGGPSFLCTPKEGLVKTLYSVNHGAGRKFTKQEAKNIFSKEKIFKSFVDKGIKLYKLGNEDICEQSPGAFKDIDMVLNSLRDNNLVQPAISTKPLAVIKG